MPYRDDEENRKLALTRSNESLIAQLEKLKEKLEKMKKPSLLKRLSPQKLGWALILVAANCVAYLAMCGVLAGALAETNNVPSDSVFTLWHPYILVSFAFVNTGIAGIALVTKS